MFERPVAAEQHLVKPDRNGVVDAVRVIDQHPAVTTSQAGFGQRHLDFDHTRRVRRDATRLQRSSNTLVAKTNQSLVDAIQAALQALVDDGTFQKPVDKYELGAFAVSSIEVNSATT